MKKTFTILSLLIATLALPKSLNASDFVLATSLGDETANVMWVNFDISEKTTLHFQNLNDEFDSHEYKNTIFDFTYMYSDSLGLRFGSWSPELDGNAEDAITLGTVWSSGNLSLGLDYHNGDNIDGTSFSASYAVQTSEKSTMFFWHGQGWDDASGSGSLIVPDTTMIGWDYTYSESTSITLTWRSIDFNLGTAGDSASGPWIGFNFSF